MEKTQTTKADIEKKIADYGQQAELTLANYHRLKGAELGLKSLLDNWVEPVVDDPPVSTPE